MNPQMNVPATSRPRRPRQPGLSYKFQRLRERLREAVRSGELTGKLPGERILARRFHANAKTLSKALTDLAAEGLLERSIGRGTYVKGSAPVTQVAGKWLLLCDPDKTTQALVQELLRLNPDSRVVSDLSMIRPSFITQFSAVIDCATSIPENFYRDLLVRGIPLIAAGNTPRSYSTHAVLMDRTLGAFCAARDLLLAGHLRLGAVDMHNSTVVYDALRRAVARYAPEATVHSCFAEEAAVFLDQGVTAIVCDSLDVASQVRQVLHRHEVDIPSGLSLAAIGYTSGEMTCSGYYVEAARHAATIQALIRDLQPARPTVLWLSGHFIDCGTIASAQAFPQRSAIHPPALLAS